MKMTLRPPFFFEEIAQRANDRWDQLERDPDLAAPWWQLFKQLQSDPRYVISELLQNADDARATWAKVTIEGNLFRFEHNGGDFSRDDLESLCRFGYSKKRNLHTIGYRGIGFKTIFSLGDRVELYTPSLAIAFNATRFTAPVWMTDAPRASHTVIQVVVDAPEKVSSIHRSLNAWRESPLPLLFFRNIRKLELNGVSIEKVILGPGPVKRSRRVRLSSDNSLEVLHLWSEEEAFPAEAIEEVRKERGDAEFQLPPTRVEIICGKMDSAKLYVVLPTSVTLETPFSVNAPFIQDPARTGIKAPSVSPTNRWLLERVGKLMAEALQPWLENDTLNLEERAQAYQLLLPTSPQASSTAVGGECSQLTIDSFREHMENACVLLSTDGAVHPPNTCLDLPAELLEVWSSAQNLELFGHDAQAVLAAQIEEDEREKLVRWGWLVRLDTDIVLDALKSGVRPPRPGTTEKLLRLWGVIEDLLREKWYYYWADRLAIFPVQGENRLYPLSELIVLGGGSDAVSQDDWAFLANHVRVVDPDWLKLLDEIAKASENQPDAPPNAAGAVALLRHMDINRRKGIGVAVDEAAKNIFGNPDPGETGIQLAYIAARADIRAPSTLRFLCEDGEWRPANSGLLYNANPALDCLPEEWLEKRLISGRYGQALEERDRLAWQRWVIPGKSGLLRFPKPEPRSSRIWNRGQLELRVVRNGGYPPESYRLKRETYLWQDYDFESDLVRAWEERAKEYPKIWAEVALGIADTWNKEWRDLSYVKVYEEGNWHQYSLKVGRLTSTWLQRLQQTKCLPDRFGNLHLPSTIYRTTPETAYLQNIEPFLAPEYDRPEYTEFWDILGVQSKPGSVDKLIERLRALSQSENPPQTALSDLYRALDRSIAFLDWEKQAKLSDMFLKEPLIFANDGSWNTSKGVFQHNSEDLLDLPTILPGLESLKLWDKLGVPREPTIDLLVQWLKTLSTGRKLKNTERNRVRKILARAPEVIWQETGHWLAMSGQWVDRGKFRWSATAREQAIALFPHIQSRIADFSMLSEEARNQSSFSALPPLESVIEHRLSEVQAQGVMFQPPWISSLADHLLRVQLSSSPDDGDMSEDWLKEAYRLRNTRFQKVREIEVIPYIDGEPVGTPQKKVVDWVDSTLYLSKDGPAVYNELAETLAAPFRLFELQQAIKACIDRPSDWIASYFPSHFDLRPSWMLPREALSAPEQGTNPAPDNNIFVVHEHESEVEIAGIDFRDNNPRNATEIGRRSTPRRHHRGDDKLARFWHRRGFAYRDESGTWASEQGILRKGNAGGLFHWILTKPDGSEYRYWVGDKPLSAGIQIPADTWHFIQRQPEATSILVPNEQGEFVEISGDMLKSLVENNKIQVYPASYRLMQSVYTLR